MKKIYIVGLLFFLLISVLFITPANEKKRSEYRSSQLRQVITQDGNIIRTDYVDDNGKITIAADVGYATKINTVTETGNLEEYFNDKGERINRYSGYYGILREFDEKGNIFRITYLDFEGNPVLIAQGYAIEEREYDDKNRITWIRYYDTEGKAILTSFGYGKHNEYDENDKVFRLTYLDENDNPIMTKAGYASIVRKYYTTKDQNNGKVEREFYFGVDGNPVRLSLGQYGVHKEYDENGRESVLTYLDAEGIPIVTTKGYTTLIRTFQANDSVASERYFDIAGNPISLSEGQYGIQIEDGHTTYLNANGVEKFNLRTLLYNMSWLVILFAVAFVWLSVFVEKKLNILLLFIYLIAIAYMTLMFRESGGGKVRLELFWSYKSILTSSENRADILKNIWLFVPLGAILYRLYPKKITLLIPIILSIIIEAIQYISGTGICEFDDVISNSLGGIIGFALSKQFCAISEKKSSRVIG